MNILNSIVEQIKASSALERERGLLSLRQLLEGLIHIELPSRVTRTDASKLLHSYLSWDNGSQGHQKSSRLQWRLVWVAESPGWYNQRSGLTDWQP